RTAQVVPLITRECSYSTQFLAVDRVAEWLSISEKHNREWGVGDSHGSPRLLGLEGQGISQISRSSVGIVLSNSVLLLRRFSLPAPRRPTPPRCAAPPRGTTRRSPWASASASGSPRAPARTGRRTR